MTDVLLQQLRIVWNGGRGVGVLNTEPISMLILSQTMPDLHTTQTGHTVALLPVHAGCFLCLM